MKQFSMDTKADSTNPGGEAAQAASDAPAAPGSTPQHSSAAWRRCQATLDEEELNRLR